jgi:hypothetical protein
MNLKRKNKQRDGSTLLLVLGIVLVLSFILVGYFNLVADERMLTARSLAWNTAIPVAEAGVEEALTQLYYQGTNNFATNGWTLGGDGLYHKSRQLVSETSYSNVYYTAVQLTAYPTIWSTGYVTAPFAGSKTFVRRLVRVVTHKSPTYGGGITAKDKVTMSGGAYVNSFDGSQGPYNPATATQNATVLTDGNITGIIDMSGGSKIYGNAVTGPNGTVTVPTAVTGTIRDDANVQINDIAPPTFSSYSITTPGSGTLNGTSYDHLFTAGNYELAKLDIGSSQMAVSGNVVIYCTFTGNNIVNVSGSGFIYITPGSSLTIYSAGNISISGGGVVNSSQRASDCFIYGLPTCTTAVYSGSSVFYGVVDTPEAAFTFSGGAGAAGSFTANTVTISGSGGVHYDTRLGGNGQGYVITSWNELPVQ